MTLTDGQLLERFWSAGDEQAFAELVRRHLGLVHSAAFRITGQASLSEDISQMVFIKLARLRSPMKAGISVITWLHRTTRSTAIDVLRAETRRKNREKTSASAEMNQTSEPWEQIAPILDEIIDRLPAAERHVVLCRYFEGRSHADLGHSLGISEDAARMKVGRSLEKIRKLLLRQGISTTGAALATLLPGHASSPLPPGLIHAITSAGIVSTASTSLSTITIGTIIMTKKTVLTAAALLIALAGSIIVVQSKSSAAHTTIPRANRPQVAANPESSSEKTGSEFRPKPRIPRNHPIPGEDPVLQAKYGESRVKLARRVAASYVGFIEDLAEIARGAEQLDGSSEATLHDLAKLELSEEQTAKAKILIHEARLRAADRLKGMSDSLRANPVPLNESLLATDAYKRGKIGKDEYTGILSSSNHELGGVLENISFKTGPIGMTLFQDETFCRDLLANLKEEQAQQLRAVIEADSARVRQQKAEKDDGAVDLEKLDVILTSIRKVQEGSEEMLENAREMQDAMRETQK